MFPPMFLYLRIGSLERPGIGLWLPLFLVWLILLPIVVLTLVITMLTDVVLILVGRPYHHYTRLLFRCLGLLGATSGVVVSIRAEENDVHIEIV
jgi:hypothetical protein